MPADPPIHDVRDLWQSQKTEAFQMSQEQIHTRIEELNRRFAAQYKAGLQGSVALIAAGLAFLLMFHTTLLRIGALLIAAGAAVMLYQVLVRRNAERAATRQATENGGTGSIDFLRGLIERQRGATSIWARCSRLLVLVPGGLLFMYGLATEYPKTLSMIYVEVATLFVAIIVAVILNIRLVRESQRELDELDAMREERRISQ
jgi:membrane protein implicated in regulation of membrane protease activity